MIKVRIRLSRLECDWKKGKVFTRVELKVFSIQISRQQYISLAFKRRKTRIIVINLIIQWYKTPIFGIVRHCIARNGSTDDTGREWKKDCIVKDEKKEKKILYHYQQCMLFVHGRY